MDLRANLLQAWLPRAGEIALVHDDTFVRFVGIGEDDRDLYYIAQAITNWDSHKTVWYSAVGALEPLKGHMREEGYARQEQRFLTAGSLPQPFLYAVDEPDPSPTWNRQTGRDVGVCRTCATPWASRVPRVPPQGIERDLMQPGCACHMRCTTCQGPKRTYALGEVHPNKQGFLCPVCDRAPLEAMIP